MPNKLENVLSMKLKEHKVYTKHFSNSLDMFSDYEKITKKEAQEFYINAFDTEHDLLEIMTGKRLDPYTVLHIISLTDNKSRKSAQKLLASTFAKKPRPKKRHIKRDIIHDEWLNRRHKFKKESHFIKAIADKHNMPRSDTIRGWIKEWKNELQPVSKPKSFQTMIKEWKNTHG